MWSDLRSWFLSCTKRDPMRPRWGKYGFVLGIIPQLGRNRFESLSFSNSENLTEQRQHSINDGTSSDCSSIGANLEMLNWIGIQIDARGTKSLSCYLSFYAKYCQANSTNKALHTPLYHIIYGFQRVSLAEYIHVLKVYSLLLQMIWCIMGTVRTAFILPWMRTKPWDGSIIGYGV